MQWTNRPRIETTIASRRRIWQSKDGHYRVVHSTPLFAGLSQRWYACRFDPADKMWDIISWHQKQKPAFAACERAARQ